MSIRILSESKREWPVAPPPKRAGAHLWLSEGELELLNRQIDGDSVLPAYISKRAEAKVRNHALSQRENQIEVMGLLLGEVRRWKESEYLLIRDAITTGLDATSVSVRFEREGFTGLFERLDDTDFDYVIVGWYHSHPGYGCFLSDTDIDTQTRMFVSPQHLAIVIDPINLDIRAFRVREMEQVPVDFVVYWEEFDDPYGGVGRIRKLDRE